MRKHILSIILSVFILLFLVSPSYAIVTYNCDYLTGGAARALDYISVDDLNTGDRAIVVVTESGVSRFYHYFKYDASGVTVENTATHPYIVRPNDFASIGVWTEVTASWIDIGSSLSISSLTIGGTGPVTSIMTDGTLSGASDVHLASALALKTFYGLPRSYLAGMSMSNASGDTNYDITISAGECRDTANTYDIVFSSSLTKQIDAAWALGNNAGGLASGAAALGSGTTTYHVHALYNPTSGVTDAGFDDSISATNLLADATGYTSYRRIGSVVITSGDTIYQFAQWGDYFYLHDPILDVNAATPGTSGVTAILSVPDGISVIALLNIAKDTAGLYVSPLAVNDEAPSLTVPPLASTWDAAGWHTESMQVLTNTSRQIRYRSSTDATVNISTLGWIDRRGRDD